MFKLMIFIKRRPDLTLAQFKHHYETAHVPLSLNNLPLMRKHARNYIRPAKGEGEPPFDCVTECWFEDKAAAKATAELIANTLKPLIAADEARFMDRGSITTRIVEEHITTREAWEAARPKADQ